jgi:EAL domain-containing protein (putative c-di-GMP-specific phosphodiesterase class I)
VQCAAGDDEGQAILSAVAGIARSLHLEFTAEGVETEEQHAAVLALGCDWVQGFLHFPALNAAQIDTLYGLPSPASPKLTFGDSIAPNV